MSDRKRLTKEINQLSPERRTTMPAIGAPPDKRRPPAGMPVKGIEQEIKAATQKGAYQEMHFLDFVTEEQQREDSSMWFEGAKDYIERTAIIDDLRRELFRQIPWKGDDLRARLARIGKLEVLIDAWKARLAQAELTLRTERADAVRMADTHVTQLDLQVRQPVTSEADRADLQKLADVPVTIWRSRNAKIQKTRGQNERMRAAAEAPTAPAAPAAPIAEAPRTLPVAPAPPPGRRGRKR